MACELALPNTERDIRLEHTETSCCEPLQSYNLKKEFEELVVAVARALEREIKPPPKPYGPDNERQCVNRRVAPMDF